MAGTFDDWSYGIYRQHLFRKEEFTLMLDMKMLDGVSDRPARNAVFGLGTEKNSVYFAPIEHTLRYGATPSGTGTAENKADLPTDHKMKVGDWTTAAIVYSESGNTGKICLYMNGTELLAGQDIGFQFIKMEDLEA